jgi:hypothetical protein
MRSRRYSGALHLDVQIFQGRATNIVGALHLGISGLSRKKQRRTKRGQKMCCPKAPSGARIFVEKTR